MDISGSFDGMLRNCEFQDGLRSGSMSSSSLVLDSERGELVRALVRPSQKAVTVKAEKALVALRNHSEAERRRRERINGHLATLRSLMPGTNKMDKASLLAKAITHLKELRKNATEASSGILLPMDIDEVRVEQQEDGTDGAPLSVMVSLCCDYKHEILSDLREALDALHVKTVRAEIATLGGRMVNVFVLTYCKEENIEDNEGRELLANSVRQAMRSVLDKFNASQEFSRAALSNKRRRACFFDSPSSSSLGDFW